MKTITRSLSKLLMLGWILLILVPIIAVIIGSFKSSEEYYSTLPYSLASDPTLDNYKQVLTNDQLLMSFINTFILILLSIIITTILSSMVAYVIERFEFKYKKLMIGIFVVISFFPMAVMQVSVFRVMTFTGLQNKFIGLALLYSVSDIVIIYLFRDSIRKLSTNLDASARVMGASYFQIYWKIILPSLKPTIMIVSIYKLVNIYNDFYFQSLYLTTKKTISTFLYQFTSPYEMLWPQICATIVVLLVVAILALAIIYGIYTKTFKEKYDQITIIR